MTIEGISRMEVSKERFSCCCCSFHKHYIKSMKEANEKEDKKSNKEPQPAYKFKNFSFLIAHLVDKTE
ncbi:CLUMA_CG004541, isoform A [Clunio marinus]|uniref:CLUMA_CG004541, isoform A n=1 Tax=Clunio marinus TaxID=568069 RepID=A0A1J1HS96_9DIPT|nr:CLUMA_CG004541, isoform A [Clunio marinus]